MKRIKQSAYLKNELKSNILQHIMVKTWKIPSDVTIIKFTLQVNHQSLLEETKITLN